MEVGRNTNWRAGKGSLLSLSPEEKVRQERTELQGSYQGVAEF